MDPNGNPIAVTNVTTNLQASNKVKAGCLIQVMAAERLLRGMRRKSLAAAVRTSLAITLLASCLLSVGCDSGIATSPVRGTVTIDGQAYTQGGSVVFQPAGKGKMASGKIGPDGSYELSTYSPGDGAVPGMHQAIVMPPPPADIGDDQAPVAQPTSPLAAVIAKTPTDELVYEVKPGETNQIDIELKSR